MANAGFRLAGAGAVSDLDVGNTLPLSARQNAKRIDDSRTPAGDSSRGCGDYRPSWFPPG
jgi:hypothetical protein